MKFDNFSEEIENVFVWDIYMYVCIQNIYNANVQSKFYIVSIYVVYKSPRK